MANEVGAPLGIFGGTFDPVHLGHLRLAQEAAASLGLGEVRWIPAGQPPHREAPRVTPIHRLDMVRLAVADNPLFTVDPAEVESAAPSYTVLTLERLRRELGAAQSLVLLVGADAFAGLPSWHRWQELFALAHIAVAHRPGFTVDPASLPAPLAAEYAARRAVFPEALAEAPAGRIVAYPMTQLDISATAIRKYLANGASPRYLVPDAVIAYIESHYLYRS